jgi:PBP1b-binding outer membrane lipoprotein LpoB
MMFSKIWMKLTCPVRFALPAALALALAGCAGTPAAPPLPQVDATGQPIIEADDVAIAGQLASHSIMDLPQVADAQNPPLVRFTGVTSAVSVPVDTEPYTELLRDRLLLITREKLRFVERQLPPLHAHKKKEVSPIGIDTNADFEIAAVLRNDASPDTYLIQIQFIDLHSGQPIFSGLYRIRPEAAAEPPGGATVPGTPIESTAPAAPGTVNPPYPPSSGGSNLQ